MTLPIVNSGRKFRFGERQAKASDDPEGPALALTKTDERNLEIFSQKIGSALSILQAEIDAIKNGELETVGALFDEKSEVLKRLELHAPLIEPFLTQKSEPIRELIKKLTELRETIEEDGDLLSRMTIAATTVRREIEKVRNRNDLSGTYGLTGRKRDASSEASLTLDKEL